MRTTFEPSVNSARLILKLTPLSAPRATLSLGGAAAGAVVGGVSSALAVAGASAGHLQLQILAIMCAVTSSFAMGLPISTPPNAIAYGTGQISTRNIMLVGGLISFAATLFIVLTGTFILTWVLNSI